MERVKDLGSISNSFCLTEQTGEVPREEAPGSGLASMPCLALSPYPADRRTPELCK